MLDFLQRLFGSKSQGDSIATVYLEEALRQPGCPICRLIAKAERHYFETFFYENVNDPGVNDELRASRGFCAEHTRTIFALDSGNQSPSGVATFFVRFMDDLLRQADSDARLLAWLRPAAPCPVCRMRLATGADYLGELARHAAMREGAKRLCAPHRRVFSHQAAVFAVLPTGPATAPAVPETGDTPARLAHIVGGRPVGELPVVPACPACQASRAASLAVEDVAALCRLHAWALYDAGRTEVAAQVQQPAPAAACPACQAATTAANAALARLYDGGALCLKHLRDALTQRRPLRASAVGPLAELAGALERFRVSFDYQYTGTRTEAERRSWVMVLDRFGGETVRSSVAQALPFADEMIDDR